MPAEPGPPLHRAGAWARIVVALIAVGGVALIVRGILELRAPAPAHDSDDWPWLDLGNHLAGWGQIALGALIVPIAGAYLVTRDWPGRDPLPRARRVRRRRR